MSFGTPSPFGAVTATAVPSTSVFGNPRTVPAFGTTSATAFSFGPATVTRSSNDSNPSTAPRTNNDSTNDQKNFFSFPNEKDCILYNTKTEDNGDIVATAFDKKGNLIMGRKRVREDGTVETRIITKPASVVADRFHEVFGGPIF